MNITAKTKKLGIIGFPAEHSFSPKMHNYISDKLGNDYIYTGFTVAPDSLGDAVRGTAVGIAAIQLGIPKALIAVSVPTEEGSDEFALANPRIVSESVQNAYLAQGEGCLSVAEEHEGLVWRHARITVTGYDLLRKDFIRVRAEGYTAICLQHEIDHLSGILFYDRINKDDPWKEDPQAEVIG